MSKKAKKMDKKLRKRAKKTTTADARNLENL